MSKKNPLHEIYRCLSEPKSVKLKEFIEDPQSLVGKILDVIPEPGGDFRIKEEVIRVTPKKAYTRDASYWIENGFESGGKGHAKVIVK